MNDPGATPFFEIGSEAEVAPNVMLGYRYPGCRQPTRIGHRARIHSGTVIYADTVIGHRFSCGHNVTIRAECEIGDRCVILHGCTLEGRLKLGKGVKLMAHIYLPSSTVIGDMVFVGPGTTFLNARMPMRAAGVKGATVGHHVMIGGGVTIGPGVTIGDNVFIGAGANVVGDIPANTLALGNPARSQPLPARFGVRNDPQQIFCGLDLWDQRPSDDTWKDEAFPGRDAWLAGQ